jgi:hypothetical protein
LFKKWGGDRALPHSLAGGWGFPVVILAGAGILAKDFDFGKVSRRKCGSEFFTD